MLINIKNLKLKNFKGIKDMSIDFGRVTNIYGENATGKTTIFDAFTWLLFDKDSTDKKDFNIKTIDENGDVIHGLEHEVEGVLEVDGKEITLRKIYKEKWTQKRGEEQRLLTGHTTEHFINDVPVKKSEYTKRINELINENIFKLVTNPLYFNTNLNWKDRRKILLEIVGNVSDQDVIATNDKLKKLETLLEDKNLEEFKKIIAFKKKKLNEELKSIPYRIDELNNSIEDIDPEVLDFRKRGIVAAINQIEESLMDNSKMYEGLMKERDKLYQLKSKLREIEFNAKLEAEKPLRHLQKELKMAENEKSQLDMELYRLNNLIETKEDLIKSIEKELAELREKWNQINQEELHIPEDSFICPTCKRPFEEHDIELKKNEMIENFNQNKSKRLSDITSTGKRKKENLEKIKGEIESLIANRNTILSKLESINKAIEKKKTEIENYNPIVNLEDNKEYIDILKEVKELELKLSSPVEVEQEIREYKAKKNELEKELEEINNSLAYHEHNQKAKKRIEELMKREKELANMIAELEGQEYLCEEFIRTKVDLLENRINSKFKNVRFKLFNTLVNGALEECCETLINGVPFQDANNAAKINAGIDIINTLSEHYQITAPIFIDNRESINQILESNSQIINLIVSKDKKLRIEVA
ncbi:AAA family ATPase [Caloranaerobacter azorensis]|uniref:Nuclease SbcCD subunit C n=1 Tax=Caloranaerobacter azorensis TaxID=116090 RepID=A0A6P1Y9P5_9FIRM|nr:AAA family ATPase [Caloranaerobacter azorensis]QIB26069.1 AAA family ATPase [Caloranaerobacter azorensis]